MFFHCTQTAPHSIIFLPHCNYDNDDLPPLIEICPTNKKGVCEDRVIVSLQLLWIPTASRGNSLENTLVEVFFFLSSSNFALLVRKVRQ